jgi:hypothetical protein
MGMENNVDEWVPDKSNQRISRPMGRGVSQQKVETVSTITGDLPPVVPLDPPTRWIDSPQFEGQFGKEGFYKQGKMSVKVYDLTEKTDLTDYGQLIQDSSLDDPTRIIIAQEKRYCEQTGNWKIYIESTTIQYKAITDEERQEGKFNQVASEMS